MAHSLTDRLRVIAVLALATAQAAAPMLWFGGAGARLAGADPTPIVPAGYAFAIWGVVFALSIGFAVAHAAPGEARGPMRWLGWPVAAVFALCILWLKCARFGPLWLTLPVFAAMVALLLPTLAYAVRAPMRGWQRAATLAMLGLYAGWSSIAVFANASELLARWRADWFIPGRDEATLVLIALAAITALAGTVIARGSLWYAGAAGWALAAIALANRTREQRLAVAGAALAALALVALATLLARRRPKPTPLSG